METRRDIEEELTQHFVGILNEDKGDRERDTNGIIGLIPKAVTRENNEILLKPIAMQEVEEVVNHMALRPDGFTSNFFHYFWDLIKEEFL